MIKDFFDLIANKITKNKIYPILAILILLLNGIDKLNTLIYKISASDFSISLLAVLLFFFFKSILHDLAIYERPSNLVKYTKLGNAIIYILFLIPVYFIGMYFYNKVIDEKICENDKKETAVFITSFSQLKNTETDGFSSILYGKLNSSLQYSDTLNIRLLSTHILEDTSNYKISLSEIFQKNCSTNGLIVYGNRISQKIDPTFTCRIYSLNFLDFTAKEFFKNTNKTIIYIQDPNEINFTIEYQATTVSTFIYGLLYRRAGHYDLSNSCFYKALSLNNNKMNTDFIALCHFFIGNNFIKLHKLVETIKQYSAGILADSTNEFLHYNIASVYSDDGEIEKAYKQYNIAHSLNKSLINPLHKINTLTSSIKPHNLRKLHIRYKLANTLFKDSIDTNIKVVIKEKWNEQCWTTQSLLTQKYGVINNKKDTLVKCLYDGIDSFPYKNADCFIVRLNNKFGAFVHIHYDDGYTMYKFPLEYSERSIREAVIYCIDNHK